MLDLKLLLQTWPNANLFANLYFSILPRVIQTYITLYFSTGFLLDTYRFPVLANSETETAIAVTPCPPSLYENLSYQIGDGSVFKCFFLQGKEKKPGSGDKLLLESITVYGM